MMNVDPTGYGWWSNFWKNVGKVVLGIAAVVGMVALTIVSFGIAAPLGALVVGGIGFGIGTGVYSGITSGKGFSGILSEALIGGLIGGGMAFALGLGMLGNTRGRGCCVKQMVRGT